MARREHDTRSSDPRRASSKATRASALGRCGGWRAMDAEDGKRRSSWDEPAGYSDDFPRLRVLANSLRRAAFSAEVSVEDGSSAAGRDTGATWPTASEYFR